MNKTILIIGGSSSGKSQMAENIVKDYSQKLNLPVFYIATAYISDNDEEFAERIKKHQQRRPITWTSIEENVNIDQEIIQAMEKKESIFLIESIGTWVSNMMYKFSTPQSFSWDQEKETMFYNFAQDFTNLLPNINGISIIVADEVGMDVVPANREARIFRDLNGQINQKISMIADEIYFVVSGIAMKIK